MAPHRRVCDAYRVSLLVCEKGQAISYEHENQCASQSFLSFCMEPKKRLALFGD
jgi:hypothetical protein